MIFILYLINSLLCFLVKTLLILTIGSVGVYYGYTFLRKLVSKGVITSDGKAVLITGCDSGFGNKLAQRLCQMGFKVYATVLNTKSEGSQLLKSDPRFADKVLVLQMDITNDTEVHEVYEKVKKDLESSGHVLWAVVNSAGIRTHSLLEWGSLDTYRKVFEVNVFGTVRVTRAFLPLIRGSKGRLINNVGIAGRSWSWKPYGIYSMSMHSLVGFSDTLRRELYNFGVKVSIIEPDIFATRTDPKELITQLETNFDESTDEVKAFYSSPQNEIKLIKSALEFVPNNANIDVVVDDMIDSIVNRWPKIIYRPIGMGYKTLVYLDIFFPSLLDWLLAVLEKFLLI